MHNIGIGIKRSETKANSFLTKLYDHCNGHVARLAISELVNLTGTSHTEETVGGPVHTFIRKQVNIINVKDRRADNDSA